MSMHHTNEIRAGDVNRAVNDESARIEMIRVAFDFCWPPLVASNDHSLRIAAESRSGREVKRVSGNQFLRLFHVRNNFFDWLLGARTQSRQRHIWRGPSVW